MSIVGGSVLVVEVQVRRPIHLFPLSPPPLIGFKFQCQRQHQRQPHYWAWMSSQKGTAWVHA